MNADHPGSRATLPAAMPPATMTPADILKDPAFPRLKALVIHRTGLAYYADKDLAFAERVGRRLLERPPTSLCAYYDTLTRETVRGDEMQALINELCVGETFFFRYVEQFEAMRVVAVPECLRRNATSRTLRIWSAGCSVGAEAYTLEILLKRHFAEELRGWRVTILGTDINRSFIDQARRGTYGDWSMRGLPATILQECFNANGNTWQVKPEFREWTRFDLFNLVEDPLPDFSRGIAAFDIILCRNVMIYFDEPTRHRLIINLRNSLQDGGWLVVGHAETGAEMNAAFTAVPVPGATLYRKPDELHSHHITPAPVAPEAPPARTSPAALATEGTATVRPRTGQRQHRGSPPLSTTVTPPPAVSVDTVAMLEEQGELVAALEICTGLVKDEPLNPAAHFHLARLQEELGVGDPMVTYRAALYLDPDFALANYHLGLVCWRRGKLVPAQRHFRNARNALSSLDDAATVREGRGLTVLELRGMIGLWLSDEDAA